MASDTETLQVEEALDKLFTDFPVVSTEPKAFWGAQFDLGLAWPDYGVGFGGLGVSPKYRELVARRFHRGASASFSRRATSSRYFGETPRPPNPTP